MHELAQKHHEKTRVKSQHENAKNGNSPQVVRKGIGHILDKQSLRTKLQQCMGMLPPGMTLFPPIPEPTSVELVEMSSRKIYLLEKKANNNEALIHHMQSCVETIAKAVNAKLPPKSTRLKN